MIVSVLNLDTCSNNRENMSRDLRDNWLNYTYFMISLVEASIFVPQPILNCCFDCSHVSPIRT